MKRIFKLLISRVKIMTRFFTFLFLRVKSLLGGLICFF